MGRYNAICAVPYLKEQSRKTFCSQQSSDCIQQDYNLTSNCLCKTSDANESTRLAVFENIWENLAYLSLTKETCNIGLERTVRGYTWLGTKDITYTNWSPAVVHLQDFMYGALSPDGWLLAKTKFEYNCSLIQKSGPNGAVDSNILIDYNDTRKNFTIHVKHPSYWLQQQDNGYPEILCFTDASTTTLFEKLETINDVLEENYANFSVNPLKLQAGHYWCTGFLYPKLEVVNSKKYLLR